MVHMTSPDHGQQTALRLWRSAADHARSALIHVTSDDDRVRGAIDAGVAVEHMAKAFLATLSPALLADRNADLDTMLHLGRVGIGGPCPHCDQPVAVNDLLDQEVFTVTNR